MKARVFLISLAATWGLAASVSAADSTFLPAWESITGEELARHVQVLASDEFEGREPGTRGEEKTLAYLEAQFRALGLEPGVGDSYLQPVPLVELKRTGEPRCSMRIGGEDMPLALGAEFAARADRPAESLEVEDLPLYFAGYGISAEETFDWDDYGSASVRGGAVLLLQSEPYSEADSTLFRGRALTVHGRPSMKYENAARRGAKAAVVIHTEERAGYPWSVLSDGGLGRTQQFLAEDGGQESLDMVIVISEPTARKMLARAGHDFDELVDRAQDPAFQVMPTGIQVSGALRGQRRDIVSHNVVARVEGDEEPDEVVIYTAHWDHVGRNSELEGDQIFNGAVDNATGTAGLLELGQAFMSLPRPPRRSVLLVATTAEEKGLLGAEYMARHPLAPLDKTVAVINLDALFPFGSFNALTVTGFGSSEVEDVLARAAGRLGRVLQDDSMPEAGAFYRSDHYPFIKRGVPAVFAVGGPRNEDLVPGSEVLGKFEHYLANGYHKVGDEYDPETWDMAGIEQDVRLFFETGWRLAEDTRFPNWYYDNEFRPLRDAMMQE